LFVSDCIRTENGVLFLVESLYWCVNECIRTENVELFLFGFFPCLLATVLGQRMAHCSVLTVCFGVLATVSGQQMYSSGLTVCIIVLTTVSGEEMLCCSILTVFIGVLATIRTANDAHFRFGILYCCVSDCIRTASVALFCVDCFLC
jgi:hypothetical protein